MLISEIYSILSNFRPAFSRKATFHWFLICVVGFICRRDFLGVTSFIRAFGLKNCLYTSLINFFHSSAWQYKPLMELWWKYIFDNRHCHLVNNRIVLIGDHTKTSRGGRKMPATISLKQDSETSSKPNFFNGHHFGFVSIVMKASGKFLSLPLFASVQDGLKGLSKERDKPKTIAMIDLAQSICVSCGKKAYCVLDAYFSVGPVLTQASNMLHSDGSPFVHIIARCKKSVVAYNKPKAKKGVTRGRKQKYGKKVKLYDLFKKTVKNKFKKAKALMYSDGFTEFEYLIMDLTWKPTKSVVRFILIKSCYGQMILCSTDLQLDAIAAVELYCRRTKIETMFNIFKNLLKGFGYHFWSKFMKPISRKPTKNNYNKNKTTNIKSTINKLQSIEKFVNVAVIALGVLQILIKKYPAEIDMKASQYMRTKKINQPSEFTAKTAVANEINALLGYKGVNTIIDLINSKREKQAKCPKRTKIAC